MAFQLTASQGGWPAAFSPIPLIILISTHSLTRRLTNFLLNPCKPRKHFNSQPHKEADADNERSKGRYSNFNSQPHKEADKSARDMSKYAGVFQLTASQGGWRFNIACPSMCQNISTHSLTRRLTKIQEDTGVTVVFQLTASQGGWR